MAIILIVEDDLLIRDMAAMSLEEWGYQTLLASDGDEARVFLGSAQKIDILFTDIYLKAEVHGGCALARHAVALRPQLGVLYTTGSVMTKSMTDMFVKDARCLRKPYAEHQLKQSIEGLLAA